MGKERERRRQRQQRATENATVKQEEPEGKVEVPEGGRDASQPAHGERRGWTGPGRGARHPPSEIRAGCRQPGKPQRTRWGAAVFNSDCNSSYLR